MGYKQNLHTHTTFDDGAHSPREVVAMARAEGFQSIGFSGHSYTPYSVFRGSMTPEKEAAYWDDVQALKAECGEEFPVFCGMEYDMYSPVDITRYDYVIGSVHYLKHGDSYISVDNTAEHIRGVIDTYFGGDGLAFAAAYYEQLAQLPQHGTFDFIGHFDLITKNCEKEPLFDVDSAEYLSLAVEAARALRGDIPYFEVNTGAIARGYRTTPYPTMPLLRELKRLGFGAVITADYHRGERIDQSFDLATELLREAGFRERYVLTKNGFIATSL